MKCRTWINRIQCENEGVYKGYCKDHGPVNLKNVVKCEICGKILKGIPYAKKWRKAKRCEEHLHEKLPKKTRKKKSKPTNKWVACKRLKGEERKRLYYQYLESREWKKKSLSCKKKYKHKCVLCNRSKDLRTHHRTYERLFDESPDDLICLCKDCHEKFHDILPNLPTREPTTSPPK